jgi:hypothetical protein
MQVGITGIALLAHQDAPCTQEVAIATIPLNLAQPLFQERRIDDTKTETSASGGIADLAQKGGE